MKMSFRLFWGGLVLVYLLFGVNSYTKAQEADTMTPPPVISPPVAGAPVTDTTSWLDRTADKISSYITNQMWAAFKKATTRTYSSLLRKYANEFANQTALYVASGGKGQKAEFYTYTWSTFATDLARNAAGTFVENYFTALEEGSTKTGTKTQDVSCGTTTVHLVLTATITNSAWYDENDVITENDITYQIDDGDIYNTIVEIQNAINSEIADPAIAITCLNDVNDASLNLRKLHKDVARAGDNSGFSLKKYLGSDFDVCQPSSIMVGFKTGLGLTGAAPNPTENLCNARDAFYGIGKDGATSSWATAIQQSINDQKTYLKNVQSIFDPRVNDLGIAFSISSRQDTMVSTSTDLGQSERRANREQNRITNPGGKYLELPGSLDIKLWDTEARKRETFFSQTGDILLDSTNLFISVLSNKLYDKYMAKLLELLAGQDDSKVTEKLSNFYSSNSFGRAESEALLAPITDMNFGAGNDLDLLNNLATCPDANNPGPMNCVVNNNFVQAISQELTVGEALKKGLLNGNARFGAAESDNSLNIESGDISWRSMKILRKYRILPVTWEVAAEKLASFDIKEKDITIGDMIGCYNPLDQYDTGYNQSWCRGMIDPNWPLKAPLSYCIKSGFGNQIDYMDILTSDQVATGTVAASLSTVNLLRSSNYCADEQSCLKEGDNNNCEIYGYCTEDRRTWQFTSDTCQPYFNTCQAYTNSSGQTTAYLANTLDYGNCNADNSGCAAYCSRYNWASSSFTCTPGNTTDKYYLSAKAETCDQNQDGCQQLIRLANNTNVNLLFNGDLEFSHAGATSSNNRLDNLIIAGSAVVVSSSDQVYSGQNALKIISETPYSGFWSYDWSQPSQSSLPKNFLLRPGVSYTFSAYVYTEQTPVTIGIGNGNPAINSDSWLTKTSNQTDRWQKLTVTINNDEYYNANAIAIYSEEPGNFYIDNMMLEISSQGNQGYRPYRQAAYTYEKILPEYLRTVCYVQNGDSLIERPDAPAECDNYARTCLPDEADCQMFTNNLTGDRIPAKINLQNYCPASCVGFASYWQEPTIFNDGQEKQLIPNLATTCSAASVGCTEFTNLDNLAAGGEDKEYFSYLRQCVKPDEPQANCAEFYIWQNTASTGLQLYSYTWQAETNGSPKLTDQSQQCTASSIQPNSVNYNPDCREVRNQAGAVFYVPYSKTVTCSANCLSYRLSKHNVVDNIADAISCQNEEGGHWLSSKAECVVCRGNGQWSDNNQACIYRGLPAESQSCAANQNTCKRYSGTGAADWRLVLNRDFDNELTSDWHGAATSSETIRTTGYSLLSNSNQIDINLDPHSLNNGAKYRLQFFAKPLSAETTITSISLKNGSADIANFDLPATGINLKNNDWQFYSYSLDVPAVSIVEAEITDYRLRLLANNRFYLDEVRLIEINDEHYLLENSITIPKACNQDYNGSPAAGFMLGCQQYQDNNGNTHYLHGFTDLCQESAVGCEAMLNTNNYTNYYYPFQPINGDVDADITPADEIIYAVYDQNKLCSATNKGCQRLGKETVYQDQAIYQATYLKVDPDRYRSDATNPISCSVDDVGCQTLVGDTSGLNFFKDPGDQLCEWRAGEDGTNFGWYKRPVKSCSQTASFKFCNDNQDCSSISSTSQCLVSQNLVACPVNNSVGKTIGLGGDIVRQPRVDNQGQNWVGLCPATQSGCTEYIDPLSRINGNIITGQPAASTAFNQTIPLDAFTSYILQVKADQPIENEAINWRLGSSFWLMNGQNKLIATSSDQNLLVNQYSENTSNVSGNGYYANTMFMTNGATNLTINISTSSAAKVKDISVRPAIVSYQLNKDLSSSECTDGKTNYDQGCLLFNERNYQQNKYSTLLYNTNLSANDANGVSPKALDGSNNANRLIKVKPSRTCGKWLECTTYNSVQANDGSIKKICTSFGLCDSLDAYNNCAHFVDLPTTPTNQTFGNNLNTDQISNLTGYSKVGVNSTGYYNDFYHLAAMTEFGKNIEQDINGSFEFATGSLTGDGQQLVYNYDANNWTNSTLSKLIVSPQQAINIDASFSNNYLAPDGNNFLRLTTKLQGNNGFYGYIKTSPTNLIKVDSDTNYSMSGVVRTINNSHAGFKVWEYTCQNPTENNPCRPQGLASNITNTMTIANTNGKWLNKVLSFTTKKDTKYIQLELDAYTENGVAYFDNIQLKPSLAYRTDGANNQFIAPTCRLYPEGNSLSCDYKSSGNSVIRKKGLMGYCLEYDPANERNCLLWYPLDKIAADPIEEGIGYNGKRPLYYCLEAANSLELEYRHAFYNGGGDCSDAHCEDGTTDEGDGDRGWEHHDCPTGYTNIEIEGNYKDDGCVADLTEIERCYCIPDGSPIISDNNTTNILKRTLQNCTDISSTTLYFTTNCYRNCFNSTYANHGTSTTCYVHNADWHNIKENVTSVNDGWHLKTENDLAAYWNKGVSISDMSSSTIKDFFLGLTGGDPYLTSEVYRDQFGVVVSNTSTPSKAPVYCTKFVKVVDDSGNNAYWSDRVKDGSSFIMPCYIPSPTSAGFNSADCLFNQSSVPFASIGYPANQGGSPENWDSMTVATLPGNQPLFYQDLAEGVHIGKIFSISTNNSAHPRYLFAQAYGGFEWQFDNGKGVNGHDYFADSGRYVANSSDAFTWTTPTNACPNNVRPTGNSANSYCLVKPIIENVQINEMPIATGGLVAFNKPVVSVNLTFNSRVDANQRPLKQIQIDWGDGTTPYDRRGNFLDRTDISAPHQFTHRYSCQAAAGNECQTNNATIILTDNWGATSSFSFRIKPSQTN